MPERPGAALDGGIGGLTAAYADGLDPTAVVDEVLARIDGANDPAVWIDVEPAEALRAAAKDLASTPRAGRPLWGVPFAVKDFGPTRRVKHDPSDSCTEQRCRSSFEASSAC